MVFQHFMLADNLTVWENIVLGDEPGSRLRMDIGAARKRILELGRNYGLDVDPDELVAELGVGDKQRAEILKVLYRNARIIILDEPTTVLVPQEVDELFDSLRGLVARGVTIIFISHKLDEVLKVADAITVIRAGRTVAEVLPSEVTARDLAELMVGSELPKPDTRESTVTEQVALRVSELHREGRGRPAALDDVSFTVHRGEILGVAGVEGNGQTELLEAIIGIQALDAGTVELEGSDLVGRRHAGAPGARDRLHPAGPPAGRPGADGAAVGERHARAPDPATVRPRALDRPGGARDAGPRRSSTSSTSARRARTSPRWRCPAATSRS